MAAGGPATSSELQMIIQNHDLIVNPLTNPNAKKIGCRCSDFEVLGELGKGAHGVVFKVKSLKNQQIYVMKKINFNNLKPSYKKEALREVQLLRRLSNPHVIR
jgi:serine/threonine protein kinase